MATKELAKKNVSLFIKLLKLTGILLITGVLLFVSCQAWYYYQNYLLMVTSIMCCLALQIAYGFLK